MNSINRYHNKPFLRLLELYILWSINDLPEKYNIILQEITPKLQNTYKSDRAWFEIIAKQMDFPENFPNMVKQVWLEREKYHKTRGENLTPEQFAINFVDTNFPN